MLKKYLLLSLIVIGSNFCMDSGSSSDSESTSFNHTENYTNKSLIIVHLNLVSKSKHIEDGLDTEETIQSLEFLIDQGHPVTQQEIIFANSHFAGEMHLALLKLFNKKSPDALQGLIKQAKEKNPSTE